MSIATEVLEPMRELADRIEEVVKVQEVTLEAARKLCNESGIHNARQSLERSVIAIGQHQEALRQAQEVERITKEKLAAALDEAEWDLGNRFVTESNKQYLITDETTDVPIGVNDDGDATFESQSVRRQMTADEKRAWIAREARRNTAVAALEAELRNAELDVAKCRDAIAVADKQFSAAKTQTIASTEILRTLALSLPATKES